jgi:hypothetical protein
MIKKYLLFKDEVQEPVEQLVNISEPGEKVHQVCTFLLRKKLRETKKVSVSITEQQMVVNF